MNKAIFTTMLSLLLTLSCGDTFADIYKYIDINGTTHYTNMPQNGKYKKIMDENGRKSRVNYEHIISRKSAKYNIRMSVIKAVITAESNWDPKAVSKKGAIGLMQLMPATARDMKIRDPYDPEENIEAGTRYLRYLLNRFNGNMRLALAAYNAGPARVERTGGIPHITETRKYVKRVMAGSRYTPAPKIFRTTASNGSIVYTNTSAKKYYNPLSNCEENV